MRTEMDDRLVCRSGPVCSVLNHSLDQRERVYRCGGVRTHKVGRYCFYVYWPMASVNTCGVSYGPRRRASLCLVLIHTWIQCEHVCDSRWKHTRVHFDNLVGVLLTVGQIACTRDLCWGSCTRLITHKSFDTHCASGCFFTERLWCGRRGKCARCTTRRALPDAWKLLGVRKLPRKGCA